MSANLIGSPAILGSYVASQEASRRKRGPVALRLQLWLDLLLSRQRLSVYIWLCQFWDLPKLEIVQVPLGNGCSWSVGVSLLQNAWPAGSGQKRLFRTRLLPLGDNPHSVWHKRSGQQYRSSQVEDFSAIRSGYKQHANQKQGAPPSRDYV